MKYDIVTLGELLVDFTECGRSAAGMRLFEQNPGGAPANVACAAARLGLSTAFVGKVGNDMHGRFLRDCLLREHVDVSALFETDAAFTTLAFVSLSPGGEREFSFARAPGADTLLSAAEIPENLLKSCRILHVGSLSLSDEPARAATFHAVRTAKKNGALISYDPNYRAPLWPGEDAARLQMRALLPLADIVKLSDSETELLTGEREPAAAAAALIAGGARCAAVTLGANGALIRTDKFSALSAACAGPVIDTTGAGDTFFAALLYRLLDSGLPDSADALADCGRFANAAAALRVGRRGAIPAMPTLAEVRQLLG